MPGESSVFCFRTEIEITVYFMVRSTDSHQSQYFTQFLPYALYNPSRLISQVDDLQYFVNPSYYIGTYYI